uniref:Uncharacterized protein n=1 Tax=Arundo donax TaxID=35708 RepID=A0A0A9A8Z2_ARUDO
MWTRASGAVRGCDRRWRWRGAATHERGGA